MERPGDHSLVLRMDGERLREAASELTMIIEFSCKKNEFKVLLESRQGADISPYPTAKQPSQEGCKAILIAIWGGAIEWRTRRDGIGELRLVEVLLRPWSRYLCGLPRVTHCHRRKTPNAIATPRGKCSKHGGVSGGGA